MSAEPTTPDDGDPADAPTDFWRGVEGQTRGEPDAKSKSTTAQVRPEGEKGRRERVLSRPTRIAAGAGLLTLAVVLAWVVVPALIGGGPTSGRRPASGALPAKARDADKRGPDRTRWAREPGASSQPRRRHAPEARQVRRRAHPRHEPSHPAPPPESPASGSPPPEPAPELSPPAPPPPAEPKEEPGLRDGATESEEFGL